MSEGRVLHIVACTHHHHRVGQNTLNSPPAQCPDTRPPSPKFRPLGSKQARDPVVGVHTRCSRGSNKALPEFLVWTLQSISTDWGRPRTLAGNINTHTSFRISFWPGFSQEAFPHYSHHPSQKCQFRVFIILCVCPSLTGPSLYVLHTNRGKLQELWSQISPVKLGKELTLFVLSIQWVNRPSVVRL